MRDALIEGWHYARQHRRDSRTILRQYAPKKDRVTLNLEALSIHNLFQSDIVDTGYMSRARWESIGGIFVETGLLPHDLCTGRLSVPTRRQTAGARSGHCFGLRY